MKLVFLTLGLYSLAILSLLFSGTLGIVGLIVYIFIAQAVIYREAKTVAIPSENPMFVNSYIGILSGLVFSVFYGMWFLLEKYRFRDSFFDVGGLIYMSIAIMGLVAFLFAFWKNRLIIKKRMTMIQHDPNSTDASARRDRLWKRIMPVIGITIVFWGIAYAGEVTYSLAVNKVQYEYCGHLFSSATSQVFSKERKVQCYKDVRQELTDTNEIVAVCSNMCNFLSDGRTYTYTYECSLSQYECFNDLAQQKNDVSFCLDGAMAHSMKMDDCVVELAYETDNAELCQYLDGGSRHDSTLSEWRKYTTNLWAQNPMSKHICEDKMYKKWKEQLRYLDSDIKKQPQNATLYEQRRQEIEALIAKLFDGTGLYQFRIDN
ncbi:MAG: hypothetical protein Q8P86_03885 [bacterium]|nr:hypothetical protein [bacterium]